MIELEHLDVNVTTSCNFRCVSCSHASPFSAPYWMNPETLKHDLALLKTFVHFKQICAVGGEPTLHAKLLDHLAVMRESGIAEKVMVITNGSKLFKMPEEFWKSFDILRLSIYGRTDASMATLAEQKASEHGFELLAWPYPEFYLQLKSIPDDGRDSFNGCPWRSSCYTVHEGKFYLCPQSAFFPKRFLGHESDSGLDLYGLTENKLRALLDRTEPFDACRICLGGYKIPKPWMEAKTESEWVQLSTNNNQYVASPEEELRMSE